MEDEVGAARQEKRKSSEEIHGCSEGGHAEEEAGTGGGGEDWKKKKVYWCGEDNPSYFLCVVVFRGGFAGMGFLKNLHLLGTHVTACEETKQSERENVRTARQNEETGSGLPDVVCCQVSQFPHRVRWM